MLQLVTLQINQLPMDVVKKLLTLLDRILLYISAENLAQVVGCVLVVCWLCMDVVCGLCVGCGLWIGCVYGCMLAVCVLGVCVW